MSRGRPITRINLGIMLFQTLLKPTGTSTPKQDQDRASHGLAKAVGQGVENDRLPGAISFWR